MSKSKFHYFSIEELKLIRDEVTNATSQEQLVETIDRVLKNKEDKLTKGMNAQFSVDWFNIDQDYIGVLHANGIDNLAQLRSIKEDLWTLKGMTYGGFEQISWARDFFDMTPIEKIKPEKRDPMTVAKVIVKHANECRKKHPNV